VDELLEVYERDMRNGGLFVPTSRPAEMDSEVSVELNLPQARKSVMTVVAKVVHRTDEPPNPGMGVAFSDPDGVVGGLFELMKEVRQKALDGGAGLVE
jgi:Tfp pilus assembly protein PilZ